ncbi:ethanolamine ammonia-lyase subunit EutC [Rariglobus hedericola]|uniref:Ethanolamine ammonia-lyase small subunit n=1 Tax=Rariglobus hedericola TaxID=2597822 RepID=A0A556QGG5_9BACT|nr:ethanolamine ammonia-lyase subunit EutC [Rariglobus hedericola]TSJ75728.1 ethanolamine ammonia-lyase subunit EutC [Rariglobus hedericola]
MENTDDAVIVPAADTGRDPWVGLRRYTSARIALGRTGGSQRMQTVLDFRLSHARARDAVMAPFDREGIAGRFVKAGFDTQRVVTAVTDKKTYLVRPDLGRRLADTSRSELQSLAPAWGQRDLVIIVSDGLAAQAAERHAVETVTLLAGQLRAAGWTIYPILLAPYGRVKLQDEVGELLGARHALMLLGERPGLGMPDSLGAYLTHHPCATCTDADRNCVSNIRPEGLPPLAAARKLAHLLIESARLGVSGVALKDTETMSRLDE